MSIKAVIFDLDGTITEPFFDFDAIRAEMGLSSQDGPVWEAMAKLSPKRRLRSEQILAYHERRAVEESRLNPGTKETLQVLRNAGIYIGVLTRNTSKNAWAVAKRHGVEFDAVAGREDGPVKPDAFGVLHLCRQFGAEPHETIVVGDYLFDIQCAKAAGAVAVLLANHEQAEDFAHYADYTIDAIEQVLQVIKKENE